MGTNYNHYVQSQQYVVTDSVYSASYGDNPGTENETNISVDYVQPVGEAIQIETGAKATFVPIRSTSDVYLLDVPSDAYHYNTTQSVSLDYKDNIYAGYLSAKFPLFDVLDVKPGLRYEYTEPRAYFSNAGNVHISSYGIYVPSGVIAHQFKNHQTVKVSYTHRIERPEYREVNPFVNASDPRNLTTGNTRLRPETGDKIELGYNRTFDKGATINAVLFYRGNRDDIQGYTRYYSSYKAGDSTYTNVAVTTRENIGKENNFGLSVFSSVPITTKINFRTNISCFQRYIINYATDGKNVQGFNYRINATATYNVSNSFIIEMFGNFNSPRVGAQGTNPAFATYNVALRKQFFDKQFSIAFTATNFFNEYIRQETKLTGIDFTLNNVRQLPYRSFGINITWKFGRLTFKNERETEDKNLTNPQE